MDSREPELERRRQSNKYLETGNLEAHIIADMLRIESITTELRDFKEDTKKRLDKLEGWIIAIVGVTVSTLIATLGGIVFKVML
jgi:hypothetical protein